MLLHAPLHDIILIGMRPEHTVAAYQLAIEQGADIIECDLAVTKVRTILLNKVDST